jgi:hypothetical protein
MNLIHLITNSISKTLAVFLLLIQNSQNAFALHMQCDILKLAKITRCEATLMGQRK